jgi:hypothetical protein
MRPPARFILYRFVSLTVLLLSTAVFVCPAAAQEQERKLLDRIERPNMSLDFGAQQKEFFGSKGFQGSSKARVKDFQYAEKFKAKDFLTGAYAGQKGAWMGDFKYKTSEADTTGRGMTKKIVKTHDTKEMPVKTSRDANKDYSTETYATRPTNFKGKSQDKIDIQGPQAVTSIQDGSFTELKTIDDIRNLLNKN